MARIRAPRLFWVGGEFGSPDAKPNLHGLLNYKERTKNMEKRRAVGYSRGPQSRERIFCFSATALRFLSREAGTFTLPINVLSLASPWQSEPPVMRR